MTNGSFDISPVTEKKRMASDRLLNAIIQQESKGELKPDRGDGGRARGPMQMHEIYYKDAVQHRPSLQSGKYTG